MLEWLALPIGLAVGALFAGGFGAVFSMVYGKLRPGELYTVPLCMLADDDTKKRLAGIMAARRTRRGLPLLPTAPKR
jgi:hypothetical protein